MGKVERKQLDKEQNLGRSTLHKEIFGGKKQFNSRVAGANSQLERNTVLGSKKQLKRLNGPSSKKVRY